MLKLKSELTLPTVGPTGFGNTPSEEETAIQGIAHQFARNVLRPIGEELDKMTAEEVLHRAPHSGLFTRSRPSSGLEPTSSTSSSPMSVFASSRSLARRWLGDAGLACPSAPRAFPANGHGHPAAARNWLILCTRQDRLDDYPIR